MWQYSSSYFMTLSSCWHKNCGNIVDLFWFETMKKVTWKATHIHFHNMDLRMKLLPLSEKCLYCNLLYFMHTIYFFISRRTYTSLNHEKQTHLIFTWNNPSVHCSQTHRSISINFCATQLVLFPPASSGAYDRVYRIVELRKFQEACPLQMLKLVTENQTVTFGFSISLQQNTKKSSLMLHADLTLNILQYLLIVTTITR